MGESRCFGTLGSDGDCLPRSAQQVGTSRWGFATGAVLGGALFFSTSAGTSRASCQSLGILWRSCAQAAGGRDDVVTFVVDVCLGDPQVAEGGGVDAPRMPRTFGWSVSLSAGRVGLGRRWQCQAVIVAVCGWRLRITCRGYGVPRALRGFDHDVGAQVVFTRTTISIMLA